MKIFQVTAFFLLSAFAGVTTAQQKDWYTVVGGPSYELTQGAGSSYSVRIALAQTLGASLPAGYQLVAKTVDVTNRLGRAEKLRDAFNVELEPETPSSGPSLVATAEIADELLAGPFGLVVRISAEPGGAAALPQQFIIVTLTVPVPELRVQPFSVDIQRSLQWRGMPTVTAAPLQIRELSTKASIRDVRLEVLRDTVPSEPDSGQLAFTPPIGTIQAGAAASAAITASGAYPLGKTSGKLEVRSKDLAAPVLVAFEVRVIESKMWIPLLAILGALAGYLLRTVFKRYQEYRAALASASEFIAALSAARASSLDATYRDKLNEARKELNEATRGKKKAAGVIAAIDEAQKKVADARTALDSSLSSLLPKVQAFRNFVDIPWRSPGPIDAPLASLRSTVFSLEQEMLARNAKAVFDRIVQAETGKGEWAAIVNAAGSYCSALASYSTHLAVARLPISGAAQTRLADVAALLTRSYPIPWVDLPTSTLEMAKTQLTIVYGDATQNRAVVEALARDALTYLEWTCSRLQLSTSERSVEDLKNITSKFIDGGVMGVEVDSRTTTFNVIDGRIARLREGWVTFCHAVAPNVATDEVEKLVRDGDWLGLVDLIAQKRPLVGTRAGSPFALSGRGEGPGEPSYSPVASPFSVPVGSSQAVHAGTAGLDGSEGEVYRLNRDSELLAFAQTLVFVVLFVLGVYLLYEDVWVGTPKEMLALLVLAFGIDLTADGVLGALKR